MARVKFTEASAADSLYLTGKPYAGKAEINGRAQAVQVIPTESGKHLMLANVWAREKAKVLMQDADGFALVNPDYIVSPSGILYNPGTIANRAPAVLLEDE